MRVVLIFFSTSLKDFMGYILSRALVNTDGVLIGE
jgi:hypothetical protein